MQEVVRAEVLNLLQAGIIYPISDTKGESYLGCTQKVGGDYCAKREGRRYAYTHYHRLEEAKCRDKEEPFSFALH